MAKLSWADVDAPYSDHAKDLWKDWDVLHFYESGDYQGSAELLLQKGRRYLLVQWGWGSCEGCDSWMGQGDQQTLQDMKSSGTEFKNLSTLISYLQGAKRTDLLKIFEEPIQIGGHYKHFKGKTYRVLTIGAHSETQETMVVYIRTEGDPKVWIRPLDMFSGYVNLAEEGEPPRFKKRFTRIE